MRGQGRAVRAHVGKMVRKFRLLRGWSQEQLAERAGSSPKNLGRVERGEVNVGVDGLADLARALSVQIGDLFAEPAGRRAARSAIHVISSEDVAQLEKVADMVRRITSPRPRQPRNSSR